MAGSYCCNLCGDMVPTKLAILAHLAHWHGKRKRKQGITAQKEWKKSDGPEVQSKNTSKVKVNREGTICPTRKDSKPKRRGEAKTTEKKNAIPNDETPATLKFSTFGRTTYGTRAKSKMGQGNSSSVQEMSSETINVARKNELPTNDGHDCFVKIRKLTENEVTPVVTKSKILVENVFDKVTNKLPRKHRSFTAPKKTNAKTRTNRFLPENKNALGSDAVNQGDNIYIPIQASNKVSDVNPDSQIDPVTQYTPEIHAVIPHKKNGILNATKTVQNFGEKNLWDELPVFNVEDEIDYNRMNNGEDDDDDRPDSPVYLFPSAKRAKAASSVQKRKMPQLTPEVPLVLIDKSFQPVEVNAGQNGRKKRPTERNSGPLIPSSSNSSFTASRSGPPQKSIARKMPPLTKFTTTESAKTHQARVHTNTLQCPLCPRQCKTGFILHRHFILKHGEQAGSKRKEGELNAADAGKVTRPHGAVGSRGQQWSIAPTPSPRQSTPKAASPGNTNSENIIVSPSIEDELEELLSSQVQVGGDMTNNQKLEENVPPETNNVNSSTTIATTKVITPTSSPSGNDETIANLSSSSFKCDQCGTFLYTAKDLSLHFCLAHVVKNEPLEESPPVPIILTLDVELYHCSACIEEFTFSHELTKHEATHGLGFACLGCGGSFKFKTNLDKHFENAHPELSMGKCTWVKCDHCVVWKSSTPEIKEHVRQSHPWTGQDIVRVKQELNSEESFWPVVDLE
ncbi:uncharacterized protein LOC110841898 [Folsomia candida]|nr:uncharacterized protein LOC110841898 [Folsomia candida]